MKVMGLQY